MALIGTKSACSIADANAFYSSIAGNIGGSSTTMLPLSTTRTIAFTPSATTTMTSVVMTFYMAGTKTNRSVTVILQENVASVWTDRVSVTLTVNDITNSSDDTNGMWIKSIPMSYAVDTTAGKWRISVSQSGGTGSSWQLRTSDGTNPFFIVFGSTEVTFSNANDTVVAQHPITIDRATRFKPILGTGDAVGVSLILCSTNNLTDPYFLKVVEGTSAYTITVDGVWTVGSHSGMRTGTLASPISVANAVTYSFVTTTAGTTATTIKGQETSPSQGGGRGYFEFYGQYPNVMKAQTTADLAVGSSSLTTNVATGWPVGATFVVGKQDIQGQGATTIHTISTISGTDITFTPNIATNVRKAGATILRQEGYGININADNATMFSFYNPMSLYLEGVNILNGGISCYNTTYYAHLVDASKYVFKNMLWRSNSTSYTRFLVSFLSPEAGALFDNLNTFRGLLIGTTNSFFNSTLRSGKVEIKNCTMISNASQIMLAASTSNTIYDIQNLRIENSATSSTAGVSACALVGKNVTFKNNYFYGCGGPFGAVRVDQLVNPTEISGNTYNNNLVAITFNSALTKGCVDQDSVFGNEKANTVDIGMEVGAIIDYTFDSQSGDLTFDDTNLPDAVTGSKLKIINYNGTANDDRTRTPGGIFRRCGHGLADTTVWTGSSFGSASLGQFSQRMSPNNAVIPLVYEDNGGAGKIIGDCQGKTVTVQARVKINSSAFWAGGHTLPTLKVTYDDGTVASAQATQTTDDQYLQVSFVPTTTNEAIYIQIEAATTATSTDGYVYIGMVDTNIPEGVSIDTTTISKWLNGEVLGTLRTFPNPENAWDALIANHKLSGTFGWFVQKLLTVGKFLGLK